jgi:polyisoprenoid-binding protein YceI
VSVGAETWVIDPAHTVSGFTVKHMMITNVTGVFEVTKGTIEYKPGEPGAVKADITIESTSVNTRIGRRDDDLRSDNFFSAEKFPTLHLQVEMRAERAGRGLRPGG